MSAEKASTLWSDAARARRFIIPDAAELPPGGFALRTSTGRERAVDEAAVLPFEVTKEEAQAWVKAQLGGVLGEVRGKAVGVVERLRQRTAEMREENRRAWAQGVQEPSDEVRRAAGHVLDGLRDLEQALRRATGAAASPPARPAEEAPPAAAEPDRGPAAPNAAESSEPASTPAEPASPPSTNPAPGAGA
ncbi:MAG TPA: hypothetical protein VEX86_07780 [Longimicrobium sp.]|nr:hypothetical protein [Longimicrobium sp.]